MDAINCLLFQKGSGNVVNSYTQWGIVCCKVPFKAGGKTKELAMNPFDLDLAFTRINAFKKWLSGNDTTSGSGAELKIYSPFETIGRQGCYLLEISDEEPCVLTKQSKGNIYHENVATFKVKFRITDPMTDIVLTT